MIRSNDTHGKTPERSTLPTGQEYQTYRNLLLSALLQLGRRGFRLPPDEGLDLIHDFLQAYWIRLQSRYVADRAQFSTYVYASFVRFARSRIVRLNRRRIVTEWITNYEIDDARSSADPVDLQAATKALSALASRERELLEGYFADSGGSERVLARKHALSRYEVRMGLADALGKIVVAFGSYGLSEQDLKIVVTIYKNQRSVSEASSLLDVPKSEIQAARARLFKRLVAAVHGETRLSNRYGRGSVKGPIDPHSIIRAAISPERPADFESIRNNRLQILAFLEENQDVIALESEPSPEQQERLLELYDALIDHDQLDVDEDVSAYLAARETQDVEVGHAMSEVLVPNLPPEVLDFDRYFDKQSRISEAEYQLLHDEPSMREAEEELRALARYGITPEIIVECARSLTGRIQEMLFDRTAPSVDVARSSADFAHFVDEIMLATLFPEMKSRALTNWLLDVARYTPSFFDGLAVRFDGDRMHVEVAKKIPDLFKRWNSSSQAFQLSDS